MKKIIYSFLLVLLSLASTVTKAQTSLVKGTVKDEKGAPVQQANITVKNSNRGTSTNNAGEFSIQIAPAEVLIISAVGFETKEITVRTSAVLEISLPLSSKDLDQVVVIGYGTQRKKDLTGAVSTIGARDVGGRQTVQVSQALQGSIAGVSVTRNNGAPGAGASILVRGITTIGDNSPLFIVDGIQVSNIDNVNPNDVENITVLKDAASASIYGSRAAAGVILVTTKRAKDGQTSFEYNYEYGVQKPTALPKYVGGADYMRYFNEQATNDGAAAGPYPLAYINNFADSNRLNPDKFPFSNTDWQKVLMSKSYAPRHRHDMVLTMGTGKLRTKASLGYVKEGSFYNNFNYERYMLRVNNDLQINPKLSASLDITYKRTATVSPVINPVYESRIMPSIFDDYYADGRYALAKDGRNPIAQLNEGGTNNGLFNQFQGRLVFNYKPVSGLTLTALVSPTFDLDKTKSFSKRINFTNPDGTPSGFVNQTRTNLVEVRSDNLFMTGQLLADYTKNFKGVHNVGVLGGYEELFTSFETQGASRSGFALTGFPYLNSGSTELRDNNGSATQSALRSYFGRVKYDFDNRFYIQGNLRYDNSSRFASQYRGALFTSVSAGWVLSQERFMKSLGALSFLKLRGSYGEVGNERIGNYPYQALISFSSALFYQNGVVTPQTGGGQVDYAVQNISWETTKTSNAGLDAAFFANRLTFSGDYYIKRTKDILLKLDIPLYLGFERPNQNAGILEVKGWDMELGWKDRAGKLNYSFAFNLSDAKSKIVDLKGTIINAGGPQTSFLGSEYNEWFGYRSNGLYQSSADTAGSPRTSANVSPGDVRYVDMNKDGKITPDDKVLLGGSQPRYIYGGNIRLDYQGIDFGLVFQGVGKRLTRMPEEVSSPFAEAFGNIPQEMVGNFWSKNNTPEQNLAARYPRLSTRSIGNNYELSDFWLMDGSYFRVKNITIGYTVKSSLLNKAGVQGLRVYVSGNDLFSISNFPGYIDPENPGYTNFNVQVNRANPGYIYPILRTFLVGASVRF